jgi:hypothetical protein
LDQVPPHFVPFTGYVTPLQDPLDFDFDDELKGLLARKRCAKKKIAIGRVANATRSRNKTEKIGMTCGWEK